MQPYIEAAKSLLNPTTLLWLSLGSALGLLLSSIPGIGPAVAISLLLPIAFHLNPLIALVFFASLYQAAEYAGSISAIAAATPGTPNAAVLTLDGFALAKKGYPKRAFAYSLWADVSSSLLTTIVLLVAARYIAAVSLSVNSVDLTTMDLLAIGLVGVLTKGNRIKGSISALLGLLLSTVGIDLSNGSLHYTFGIPQLYSGIPLIPLLLAMFAIPVAVKLIGVNSATSPTNTTQPRQERRRFVRLKWQEWREVFPSVILGTVIGAVLGIVPGISGSIPPWVTYGVMKSRYKGNCQFGNGVPQGISAPEATNGAVMHSTLIPTFFLGIPGTPTSAVILGAMTIVGLQPGPLVFRDHENIILAVFMALVVGAMFILIVGSLVTTGWARLIIRIDKRMLGVAILLMVTIGCYVTTGNAFGVVIGFILGIIGVIIVRHEFSAPALVVGFVLGGQFQVHATTALTFSHGSFLPFVTDPLSATLLATVIILITVKLIRKTVRNNRISKIR